MLKIDEFENIPHILTFSSEMPIYKGLRHVRDIHFSLPSPSLFSLCALISLCDGNECGPKREGNVRDIHSPSRPSNALCIRV
jgi:hypothetical protein